MKCIKKVLFSALFFSLTISSWAAFFSTNKPAKSFSGDEGKETLDSVLSHFDFSILNGKNLTSFYLENNPSDDIQRTEIKFVQEGDRVYEIRTTYPGNEPEEECFIDVFYGSRQVQHLSNMGRVSKKPVLFDVNFDGYDDLLCLESYGSGGIWYGMYLWDNSKRLFCKNDDLLSVPEFDFQKKIIYEYSQNINSDITYSYSTFKNLQKIPLLEVEMLVQDEKMTLTAVVYLEDSHKNKMEVEIPASYETLSAKEQQKIQQQFTAVMNEIKKILK